MVEVVGFALCAAECLVIDDNRTKLGIVCHAMTSPRPSGPACLQMLDATLAENVACTLRDRAMRQQNAHEGRGVKVIYAGCDHQTT
jgi:hypothetical protein